MGLTIGPAIQTMCSNDSCHAERQLVIILGNLLRLQLGWVSQDCWMAHHDADVTFWTDKFGVQH